MLTLSKSTLNYLRENITGKRPFMVYGKVRKKLERESPLSTTVGSVAKVVAGAGIAGVLLVRLGERDGIPPAQAQPAPVAVWLDTVAPNVGVSTTEVDSPGL